MFLNVLLVLKIREAVTWLSQHSADDLGITSTRLIDYIEEGKVMMIVDDDNYYG